MIRLECAPGACHREVIGPAVGKHGHVDGAPYLGWQPIWHSPIRGEGEWLAGVILGYRVNFELAVFRYCLSGTVPRAVYRLGSLLRVQQRRRWAFFTATLRKSLRNGAG